MVAKDQTEIISLLKPFFDAGIHWFYSTTCHMD